MLTPGPISLGRIPPYLDAVEGGYTHVEEDAIEHWHGDVLKGEQRFGLGRVLGYLMMDSGVSQAQRMLESGLWRS